MNRLTEVRAAKDWLESSTEPTETEDGGPLYPGVKWLDDSSTPNVLKLRNSTNDGWDTVGPVSLDDLTDATTAGGVEGDVLTQQADGTYAPEPSAGSSSTRFTVEAGHVDGATASVLWRWGIDATTGQPYFDDAGADVGEEAVVTVDTGRFYFEEANL